MGTGLRKENAPKGIPEIRWQGWSSLLGAGMLLLMAGFLAVILFDFDPVFRYLVYAGYLLWLSGLLLWVFPVFTLKAKGGVPGGSHYTDTSRLVTTGLYRLVRHPQYLGYILIDAGLILKTQHGVVVVLALASVICIYQGAKDEEKLLHNLFGEAYTVYAAKVPRMNIFRGAWRHFQNVRRKF